jgi:tol-pal system protein YbgF
MDGSMRTRRGGFAMNAWLPLCMLSAVLFAPTAQAGLFEDEDARKAILDLRQRVDQGSEQSKVQGEQLRRSLLDLNNQLEALRAETARLRGQNEQLARDVAEVQRQLKDLKQGVDERVGKFEPQKVTVDGKEFVAEPEERRLYDEAMATLRKGDFAAAASAFAAFQKRYPKSGYADSVLFWLGNAQYGKRDYGAAMASFRALVAAAPDNPRAPEALLSLANCQLELKDGKGARKTLDDLVKAYPKSEAAQAGRERLATLK